VDATIAAALISGGVGALGIVGTVVTAVVGSRETRKATEQTLAAARDDRLWEKRCRAYEETIARCLSRRNKRLDALDDGIDKWSEKQLVEFIVTYESDTAEVAALSRLMPYASDLVVESVGGCRKADLKVWEACASWRDLSLDSKEAADDAALVKARAAVDSALRVVQKLEWDLVHVIRVELARGPEAAREEAEVVRRLPADATALARRG
jgi:hypothetical protein